jgi:hypothetical protein
VLTTRTPDPALRLTFQPELCPTLPRIIGCADFLEYTRQLERIDELLRLSGVEQEHLRQQRAAWLSTCAREPSVKVQQRFERSTRQALRCNLARTLLNESFIGFQIRLSESGVLQKFCGLWQLDQIRVPSKSQLHRFADQADRGQIQALLDRLLTQALATGEAGQVLGLEEPLNLDTCLLDSTCLRLNIHFPTDWVLLRDAVRTLCKAIELIRKNGLKNRMRPPAEFIRRSNVMAIEMTQTRRRKEGKKKRKAILRRMKKLSHCVARHARIHRELIDQHGPVGKLKVGHIRQIMARIDRILEQLPAAIEQAHERIIGERPVPNARKILSLYEKDTQVLVRGKAGAEVEFGRQLLIGENPQGFILDWQLLANRSANDSTLLQPSIERVLEGTGRCLQGVCTDRGFQSAANSQWLEEQGLRDATCPRDPAELRQQMKTADFAQDQTRRAQTEGRIGILKNVFLGGRLRRKGGVHQEVQVAWAILAHNLWVLARLPQAKTKANAPPELELAQAV